MHGFGDTDQPDRTETVVEYDGTDIQRFVSDVEILVMAIISSREHPIARQAKWLAGNYWESDALDRARAMLQSLRDNLLNGNIRTERPTDAGLVPADAEHAVAVIEWIVGRFHEVIVSLRRRHGGRSALEVADEYDVQDVLRSLLLVHFDDVRDEEWTPSTVTASARLDLLLKRHRIAIETKMTRRGLGDRQLIEELAQDISLFPGHPDCKRLIIVVYDPDSRIKNPASLRDLETRGSIPVRVLISPPR